MSYNTEISFRENFQKNQIHNTRLERDLDVSYHILVQQNRSISQTYVKNHKPLQ